MTRLARVAALALGATVLTVPVGAQPASAATCAAGSGVSVVVDPNSLGGSVATSCVADGGGDTASALFAAAGHSLTYAQRQPGFVCRVDGAPADDPCVNTSPADRFWSLWWSDGTSGSWTFSTQGVTALKIPEGGSVAFSFDDVEGEARPSATPPQGSAPSATPTTGSGGSGSGGSSGGSSGSTGAGSGSPAATGSPTNPTPTPGAGEPSGEPRGRDRRSDEAGDRKGRDRRTGGAATEPSDEPSEDAADEAVADGVVSDPDAAPVSAETDGLPVWVAPVALLVLALGAGGAVLARRRSLR
ncbi:unannotated protein [freshwater metagenome]|uniref:Unannotated protein n=1 Tax=freshwater metagenome TaxID=449393 RepID=A0A6J6S069_9ZZZZ|nr:hypothetical protein [Actinomycetota bacterium]